MTRQAINRTLLLLFVIGLSAATIAGCAKKNATKPAAGPPATAVNVTPVSTGSISQSVYVTGNVATLFDVNLSAQTTGQIDYIDVREGDTVKKGQLLIQIDPKVAQAAVDQARANLWDDEAKLQQARLQYSQSITNANVAVNQAQQQLQAALQSLSTTKFPYQPPQITQIHDQLIQQQANAKNAETFYARESLLYKQGVISASDYDNAYTSYKTQQALLQNYEQAYNLALAGGRPQQVEAAKQVVAEQEQAVKNAKANRTQVAVNKDAIVAAQDTVEAAQATLNQTQQQLTYTSIHSPINGVVASRTTDPGQVATPGTTLLELVDLHTVYYQPTVSEDDFKQLSLGQQVYVQVDAYPGRMYHGKITAVFPSASSANRQFSVRVTIPNPDQSLRPGMYARGSIITRTDRNAVIVPVSALVAQLPPGFSANSSSNQASYGGVTLPPETVFVVGPGNKAEQRTVTVGIETATEAEITSGLQPGDQLITTGQGLLSAGAPVRVVGQKHKELAQASQ
jgi:HlyD family secretion protein